MSKFQIALFALFALFIFVAVMVFALYRGSSSSQVSITVWGSLPVEDMNRLLMDEAFSQDKAVQITYEEKPADTIEEEFTEALAEGRGPDLIILRQDQFWGNRKRLLPIPYGSISSADFQDLFIEAGDIYLLPDGIYALPMVVDPIVLYYNKDLLTSVGAAKPIVFWDEIYTAANDLTKRDAAGNLIQSAIALGEMRNIANGKDILSLLLLQAGTPVTAFQGDLLRSVLGEVFSGVIKPAESAVEFYTQFSNPTKSFYSWNRTLPEAQTRFTSGSLAYYLGFASEFRALRNKNPTLNFAVSSVPQSRVSGKSITTGRLYSVSLSRAAPNPAGAVAAAYKLISKGSIQALGTFTPYAPARRDLLVVKPNDQAGATFYTAALQSRVWIDPNPHTTAKLFTDLVDSVTSGRARVSEAVGSADRELQKLIED